MIIKRILNGASRSNLDEPLVHAQTTMTQWKMPKVDLRELALLRFNQGKTEREFAEHFGRSKNVIHDLLKKMGTREPKTPD
jgi:hypothetical protein